MAKIQASARVTITVEVTPTDTWGDDCKLDQIYAQGAEAAIGALMKQLTAPVGANGIALHPAGKFRIVGEPVVRAVIVDRNGA